MPLVNTKKFYEQALHGSYAIGGFQAYNMEMIQAIVHAASCRRSPVLVQSSCRGVRYAEAETLVRIAERAAEKENIPVVLHLDHGDSVELCKQVIDAGFTSVMLDCTDLPIEVQIEQTLEVVQYAHQRNVTVEGEIALRGEFDEVWMTAKQDAVRFCRETGCDSLSICAGNSHALYGRGFPREKKPQLRLNLLHDIHMEMPMMPLVLHSIFTSADELEQRFRAAGGVAETHHGFTVEELHKAMKLGVVKCNVGINKIAFSTGIREWMGRHPEDTDPRSYLGEGRRVMTEAVKDMIRTLFLSEGQLGGVL